MSNNNSSRIAFLLLGASLALGFTFAADRLAKGLVQSRKSSSVTVKGMAVTRVVSDLAIWRGEFSVRSADLAQASKESDAQRVVVDAFCRANGATASEVAFSAPGVEAREEVDDKGRKTGKISHFVVRRVVEVRSREVGRVAALAAATADLVAKGVEFTTGSPQYLVTDLEKPKRDLLETAAKNARERADVLVRNSGGALGRLVSVQQGVFLVSAPNSTDTSDYGQYDTGSIEKSVKLVVTADFEVAPK